MLRGMRRGTLRWSLEHAQVPPHLTLPPAKPAPKAANPRAKPSTKAAKPAAQVGAKPAAKPAAGEPIPVAPVEHVQLFKVSYSGLPLSRPEHTSQ